MVALSWTAALCASAPDAPRQSYAFRSVVVGGGGYSPAVVFSPVVEGLAYLRTDIGGAYRWDSAAGRWIPLMDQFAAPRFMGVESIAPDPVAGNRVYAAVGMYASQPAAMLASDDRGGHWRVTPVPFTMGGNEDGRGMGERLAVDPHHPAVLLFGTRHEGMWRSLDGGRSWHKLTGFPYPGAGGGGRGGVGWVLFDPRPGSRRVWAGIADDGDAGLAVSDDAGASWRRLRGGPAGLMPVKADCDGAGTLYVAYADGIGPNGVHSGAVWALSAQGTWRDITPGAGAGAGRAEGGYMGIAADHREAGVVTVASLDRWHPGDTVWRSTDGGVHWQDLGARSHHEASYSPFIDHLDGSRQMGHWMTGLAIDPFDGGHIGFTTGAGVFAAADVARPGPITWTAWTQGVEETAVLALVSPTGGAPLLSGLGDIGGFVHARLDVSPPAPFENPFLPNTNQLDYAGLSPAVVVRTGTARNADPATVATLALSRDGGQSWTPLRVPRLAGVPGEPGERFDLTGDASLVVAADGATLVVNTPVPLVSRDNGGHWAAVAGLGPGMRVIADKSDPRTFYAVDFAGGRILASHDAAASFAPVAAQGLPTELSSLRPYGREAPFNFVAVPGRAGELWALIGGAVWFSRDGGASFASRTHRAPYFGTFAVGKSAKARPWPTLFASSGDGGMSDLWMSVDGGDQWRRINDDSQRWGGTIRVLSGDPRIFGRVYVGTNGRGILAGDPAP